MLSQVRSGEKSWKTAFYSGMTYMGETPWGEGKLIYIWSKKQMEVITGTFKKDTVLNARVDMIPEGCSYAGTLIYDIDDNDGVMTLEFVDGVLSINGADYGIEKQKYKSYCYDKDFRIGTKSNEKGMYWLNVMDADANEFTIDFNDMLDRTHFPVLKEGYRTVKKRVGFPIRLQLKLSKNKLEVMQASKSSSARIKSKDGEFAIDNERLADEKKMVCKLNETSQMTFIGHYNTSNHFIVTQLSAVDLILKDGTKIKAKMKDMSDLLLNGTIIYTNGNRMQGNFKLDLSKHNTVTDYVEQATKDDILIIDGRVSNPNGDVAEYKSPEQIKREKKELEARLEQERKAKEQAERQAKLLAKQKEDSIWNTIPIQTYSGLYQSDVQDDAGFLSSYRVRTKNLIGNISYSYRVRDGKRAFEGPVKYHNDFVTITGNYEHGLKSGKWTYKYNSEKDTRKVPKNEKNTFFIYNIYDITIEYKEGKKHGRYTLVEKQKDGTIINQISLIINDGNIVEIVNAQYLTKIYFTKDGDLTEITIDRPQISGKIKDEDNFTLTIIPSGTQKQIYDAFYETHINGLHRIQYTNKSTGEERVMETSSSAIDNIDELMRKAKWDVEDILP